VTVLWSDGVKVKIETRCIVKMLCLVYSLCLQGGVGLGNVSDNLRRNSYRTLALRPPGEAWGWGVYLGAIRRKWNGRVAKTTEELG
jgi:hypothetical protein